MGEGLVNHSEMDAKFQKPKWVSQMSWSVKPHLANRDNRDSILARDNVGRCVGSLIHEELLESVGLS